MLTWVGANLHVLLCG